jgi:hypothetical protein
MALHALRYSGGGASEQATPTGLATEEIDGDKMNYLVDACLFIRNKTLFLIGSDE